MKAHNLFKTGPLAALLGAAFALSCENPLRETLATAVGDFYAVNTRVLASGAVIGTGAGIDKASSIVFEFSQGMDESAVDLSGDLLQDSAGPLWSARDKPRDTLTLAPRAAWSGGSDRSLTLSFRSGGRTRTALALSLGVLDGVVYASAASGSDAWPGTAERPKKSVQAAVDTAAAFYAKAEVRVAGGVYPVKYSLGTHVRMKTGISLLGGFSPGNWSARDPAAWPSEIVDGSVGVADATTRAVDCGLGLGADTLLEGFTVRGGGDASTQASCAICCASSGPTIRNVIATGGAAPLTAALIVKTGTPFVTGCALDGGAGADSIGIYTKNCGSGLVIEGNTISGGQGNVSRSGVENYGELQGLSAPVIRGNVIVASDGMPNIAVGVWNMNSDALIEANTIRAGSFYNSGIGVNDEPGSRTIMRNNLISGGESYVGKSAAVAVGILVNGERSTIRNNTICGGKTDGSFSTCVTTGIHLYQGIAAGATVIENNIVFTLGGNSRSGVIQTGVGVFPLSFANNLVFDCPFALYSIYDATAPVYVTTGAGFASLPAWASGNLSGDPLFVARTGATGGAAGSDWHLGALSPAKGAGLVRADVTTDREGAARTGAPSIGAFQ